MALYRTPKKRNVESIKIVGLLEVGETLTAVVSPSIATGTYVWYSGNDVVGSNSSTYTLQSSDRAKKIKCEFTGDGFYFGTVVSAVTSAVYGWVHHTANSLSNAIIGKHDRYSTIHSFPPSMGQYVGPMETANVKYNSNYVATKYRINKVKIYIQNYGIDDSGSTISNEKFVTLKLTANGSTYSTNAGEVTITYSVSPIVVGNNTYPLVYYCTSSFPFGRIYYKSYGYVSDWDEWSNT